MHKLQCMGNEEKRASHGVHIQSPWNCHFCYVFCYRLRGIHCYRKVNSIDFFVKKIKQKKNLNLDQQLKIFLSCSLAGMCLMFTGLYFVLWAKRKEGIEGISITDDDDDDDCSLEPEYDIEKPLLA